MSSNAHSADRRVIAQRSEELQVGPALLEYGEDLRKPSGIQSFTKPPRRLSNKIKPGDFFFGSPARRQTLPAEEPLSNTPEGQLAQELGSATRNASVGMSLGAGLDGSMDVDFEDEDPLEPDLPPTPTQLGLEKAPGRPRGILSSSPSARHEKRMKRRATEALQGSPLKALKFGSTDVPEDADDVLSESEELSAAILEKQQSRKSLRAELQQLRNEVAELTKWTGRVESNEDLATDSKELDDFLELLSEETSHLNRPAPKQNRASMSSIICRLLPFSTNIPLPYREASPLPTNPYALEETSRSAPYLTVFAPLALHTTINRATTSKAAIIETHTLTFTAPRPFPPTLYNVSVVYETNPETQCVTSVSVPTGSSSKKRRVPTGLRQWIDSRLENPLLKLDVATLCWGINRYWEACVARAHLWVQIDENFGSQPGKKPSIGSQAGVISLADVRRLIPHLERSTMIIKPNPPSTAPSILLSNILTMDDWTGEPRLDPDLGVSSSGANGGSGSKVNQEAKKLFHTMLHANDLTSTSKIAGEVNLVAISRTTKATLDALQTRA
ncbi:hypothetical protein N7470_010289 [Penicillium chermesinum]|nr:hypothetical protein N7470_010289 [Penicillium chermesinum]